MRTIFIIFLKLVTLSSTLAQNLTANELMEQTKCQSFERFNEFIIAKGYSFSSYTATANGDMYIFLSDKAFNDASGKVMIKNSAVIVLSKDRNKVTIGFRTVDKAYRQKLQSAFEGKGFKSTTVLNQKDGVRIGYKSATYQNIELAIATDKWENSDGKWTSYYFEVEKSK